MKNMPKHIKNINPFILHSQKGISNISQQGGVHINMQDLIQSIFATIQNYMNCCVVFCFLFF